MDRLDAIRIFVRVVEAGNFSAVAREMNVGQPAVSKYIASLEEYLGAQLLLRTSRNHNLTDAGQDFYESAVRLISDLEAAESRVGRNQASPSGAIRVSVAQGFGQLFIVPKLAEFFELYPSIAVELLVSERTVNLVEEGIDLAIRNGEQSDSTMISRKIGESPIITVATSDYLARTGTPMHPDDLAQHSVVTFAAQEGFRPLFYKVAGERVEVRPRGRFRTNDAEQLRAGVSEHLGLCQSPAWLFQRELAAGTVQRVLQEFEPGQLAISAVRPSARRLAGRVGVFIEFLARTLAES
jgi:DNA-binding transcriptional LysR family regulator